MRFLFLIFQLTLFDLTDGDYNCDRGHNLYCDCDC